MSLATRCPHCNTIFKVVQDQLKVSEGWVRCGRCHDVFNALEGLFDMEREPPPQRVVQPPPEPPAPPVQAPEADTLPASSWNAPSGDIQPQEELQPPAAVSPEPAPARSTLVGDAIELMDAPKGAVTNFELDMPPSAEAMAAAVSNLMQPPLQAAEQSLPVTDESDALDSRYLLPGDERSGPAVRRQHGPEFADARFPSDAMAEALGWNDEWAPSDEAVALDAPRQQGPADEPPAGAQLLSRLEGVDESSAAAFAGDGVAPDEPGPAAASQEAYRPEQSLPPPSKRKGRPGTRGRSPHASEEPEFIRLAERKAIWRHPVIRGVLALMALLLGVLLTAQVVHHERDLLAARYPGLSPWLHQWCDVAGCTVEAPRQLNELQVDNIAMVRTSSLGEDTYRLTAIIRNHAPMALAWPHLDLSLTDTNGEVVVRRVFAVTSAQVKTAATPEGASADEASTRVPPDVPAHSSTTLQWQLRAPDLQLAGYTAELFYP